MTNYKALMARLQALEAAAGRAPMEIIEVETRPNAQQRALIERAERFGNRVMVLIRDGDSLWLSGSGPAPWDEETKGTT